MLTVLSFLALILPLTLSPGPATIALAGTGMRNGFVRSLPFYFGLLLAVFAIAIVSALGLSALLASPGPVRETVRWAGIVYIAYLSWKFLSARPTARRDESDPDVGTYTLMDGVLLTALNPKFYAVVVAVFSQFTPPGGDLLATLALIFGFTAVLAFSQTVWLAAGAALKPFVNSPQAMRIQSLVFGVLLLGVAVWMALSAL